MPKVIQCMRWIYHTDRNTCADTVSFLAGYSAQQPFSSFQINLNAQTGEITATPQALNIEQFFIVERISNGIFLGETSHDVGIYIQSLSNNYPSLGFGWNLQQLKRSAPAVKVVLMSLLLIPIWHKHFHSKLSSARWYDDQLYRRSA